MIFEISDGNRIALGLFDDRASMEHAVNMLKLQGFNQEDLSVIAANAEGSAVCASLEWLSDVGLLETPMDGVFLAAGPLKASIVNERFGGTMGVLAKALAGFGVLDSEAIRYEHEIKGGKMLVSVHSDDPEWVYKAEDIFTAAGAVEFFAEPEELLFRPHEAPRGEIFSRATG